MTKWWLVYKREDAERNREAIRMYGEACSRRGIEPVLLLYEDLQGALPEGPLPPVCINRTREAGFAGALEEKGVQVFNGAELTRLGNDKALALSYAQKKGIPVMPFSEDPEKIPLPCVVKSLAGHGGTEVYLTMTEQDRESAETALLAKGASFIYQKPASDLGKDLRVYILGNRITAAVLRTSKKDFRSNFCLGGEAQLHTLTQEEEELTLRLLEGLQADYCGIDFIYDHGHPVFNEIEDVVGARMLYRLTERNIIAEYVDYMADMTDMAGEI